MHHHQQTLRDLERQEEPSTAAILAGAVMTVLALACICAALFTI